jgi:hypothetical protein
LLHFLRFGLSVDELKHVVGTEREREVTSRIIAAAA